MKQLIEDATVSLKINGVVSEMYPNLTKDQIKEIQIIVQDPDWTYKESGVIPDGMWGAETKYDWRKWKKRQTNDN